MEKIVVPFKPDYADWLHARRLLRRREKIHYFYDFGLPAGMCIGLVAAMIRPPYSLGLLLVGMLAIVCIAGYTPLLNRLQWRRAWKREQGQAFIELTDDSVNVRYESNDNQGNSSVPWRAIKSFDEDTRVFFFLTKGAMLFVPKSLLSTDESDAIRNLASDKVCA